MPAPTATAAATATVTTAGAIAITTGAAPTAIGTCTRTTAWPCAMTMASHDRYGDHDMVVRHDDGERRMWDDHARAYVDGSVHHEDEDRRGWDDHEYAQRDDGMHWDNGDVRAHVYYEERERTFEHGEHWIEHCGCGPARPTATDEDGYLVWAGKVCRPTTQTMRPGRSIPSYA